MKKEIIIYGKRVVQYLLTKHPSLLREFYILKGKRFKEFKPYLKGVIVKFIDNRTAQRMSRGGNHQGFLAKIEWDYNPPTITGRFILILDRVTDMGNIGAITRTAYCLGVDLLIVTGIKKLKWETIIRTSAGAGLDMPILVESNLLDLINRLKGKGYLVVGAERGGESKISASKIALILGNEGEGLSGKVRKRLDKILTIELKREFDSLNVSTAAAILIDRIANGN